MVRAAQVVKVGVANGPLLVERTFYLHDDNEVEALKESVEALGAIFSREGSVQVTGAYEVIAAVKKEAELARQSAI